MFAGIIGWRSETDLDARTLARLLWTGSLRRRGCRMRAADGCAAGWRAGRQTTMAWLIRLI